MELTPGTVIDRYTVLRPLGRGGMAEVWLVRHDQLGSLHALKILLVASRDVRERLMLEGRVQAALRHPNIVAVTDVLSVAGAPGLVLEYVDGPTLDRVLEDEPLTLAQIDSLAVGILRGVAHAHKQGLVHRDLKPGNVMLALGAEGFIAKVNDFGLAKVLASEGEAPVHKTRSGATLGTPCYMAPEQIGDTRNVDHRADVWALGALLYELVAGRRAFPQDDIADLLIAVRQGQFVPISEVVPREALPERMRMAIEGAMVVDRQQRTPDVATLLATWTGDVGAAGGVWSSDRLERYRQSVGGELTPVVDLHTLDSLTSGSADTFAGVAPSVMPPATVWEQGAKPQLVVSPNEPLAEPAAARPARWFFLPVWLPQPPTWLLGLGLASGAGTVVAGAVVVTTLGVGAAYVASSPEPEPLPAVEPAPEVVEPPPAVEVVPVDPPKAEPLRPKVIPKPVLAETAPVVVQDPVVRYASGVKPILLKGPESVDLPVHGTSTVRPGTYVVYFADGRATDLSLVLEAGAQVSLKCLVKCDCDPSPCP